MSDERKRKRRPRLVALTVRLLALMAAFSVVAIVGIVLCVDRRLSSEEQLAVCLWIGLFVGILCGVGVHIALLRRANPQASRE